MKTAVRRKFAEALGKDRNRACRVVTCSSRRWRTFATSCIQISQPQLFNKTTVTESGFWAHLHVRDHLCKEKKSRLARSVNTGSGSTARHTIVALGLLAQPGEESLAVCRCQFLEPFVAGCDVRGYLSRCAEVVSKLFSSTPDVRGTTEGQKKRHKTNARADRDERRGGDDLLQWPWL